MANAKSESVERVRQALVEKGLAVQVKELSQSTRTAPEAAAAVGCEVAQIVKSLVFRGTASDRCVLALVSGANRASEALLSGAIGESVGRADAAFVRERTGFAIGGVAPVGHKEPPAVVIDRDLLGFPLLWAAAGSPFSVFPVTPAELQRITGGTVADIADRSTP